MKIDYWTAIDNLDLGLNNYFNYIRFEAEELYTDDEWLVFDTVESLFRKNHEWLFEDLNFNDVVEIEYYPFDPVEYEEDDYVGYAVYISFRYDLVKRIYNHVIEEHPDHILKHLHWLENL